MENKQTAIIRSQLERAKEAIETNPEVEFLYRGGLTLPEIGNYLAKDGLKGNSLDQVAGRMIRGHQGGFKIKPFEGLIPDKEERKKIAREHRIASNEISYENGVGMHGMTLEDRRESGSGMFGLDSTERSKLANKMVLARGAIPWTHIISKSTGVNEEQYLLQLANSNDYKIKTGQNAGKRDCARITKELNIQYNHNRKPNQVNSKLYKLSKEK